MFYEGREHEQHGQVKHRTGKKPFGYDQRLTLRMIADEVNMNRETVRLIPTEELGMRKICAQMVPRNLTEQQRDAQFLTSKCITVTPQPPSSPDLTPCNLFLFQKVKSTVKGRHFESTENIQRSVTQALTTSHKMHSREATKNGSTVGKRVCRHKGCPLKVTTFQFMNK
jgi:hypothetical protein